MYTIASAIPSSDNLTKLYKCNCEDFKNSQHL